MGDVTYAAGIPAGIGGAEEVVDDTTGGVATVVLFALVVGLHSDRHLLQDTGLRSS